MIRDFYTLTKPGIIGGNLVSATGGFFLACGWHHFDVLLFCATLIGIALIVASGCVINNFYDRDIDALMSRTQDRLLVTHEINPLYIGLYSAVLGLLGIVLVAIFCNGLTALLGLVGFITYVVFYTIWLKRKSPISTIIGSISGAMPPVMGYCAVTDVWDLGACYLFLIFCLWQMPHHYAIGIYRLQDYADAHIPVLPIVEGVPKTFNHITLYIIAFWVASSLLTFSGYTGYWYLIGTSLINGWWLSSALKKNDDDKVKARTIFLQSIAVITLHSILMSLDSLQ